MCFCGKQKKVWHFMQNRMTDQPIKFNSNEVADLRKKFDKVAEKKKNIDCPSFKKNMGILGLRSAHQFSDRLFNSFDIDGDGKISFQDFAEYMEVLKCGSDRNKARLSFKLIDHKNQNRITKEQFQSFINDFFKSWSSITNISLTNDIKQKTNEHVNNIFKKVRSDLNVPEIDFKYYSEKLYKNPEFMEAFHFITEGVANIFISDRSYSDRNENSRILFNVLKDIRYINDTIFNLHTEESLQFEEILVEEIPKSIPRTTGKLLPSKMSRQDKFNLEDYVKEEKPNHIHKRNSNWRNSEESQWKKDKDSEETLTKSVQNSSKYPSESMAEKKLEFIREKLDKLINETHGVYDTLFEKYQNHSPMKPEKKVEKVNVHKRCPQTEGKMIFFGDDNWNLVLNMMIGIQMAVRSVKGYQQMIYEEPRDFGLKYYFELVPRRFGDEQYQSTIYSFTDYAPNTFNHIRRCFKIDNEDYINSIGPNKLMASLMLGQVSSMTSLTSQGKSGSFFYYTADSKYMLKTIHYREYHFLREILEDYYYYVKKNPKTLITKFYGLHKLMEKDSKGDVIAKTYFVIMGNVFNIKNKITERYDIKGSWYGRTNTDLDPNATKKDNDFKARRPITLDSEDRHELLDTIRKDARFFMEHEIIDYSLLIGVIKTQKKAQNQVEMMSESQQCRETKTYHSTSANQSYIFGVIDILTHYNSRKAVEYYFKRVFYGEGISAVPPEEYEERFVSFITNSVFIDKDELKKSVFKKS